MRLVDTNVLIYAHRRDANRHAEYRDWVQALVDGPEAYAVADSAVNALVRIVTDKRIYPDPTPLDDALAFAGEIRNQKHAQVVNPGTRFWLIFADICRRAGARGKLVPDAYLASLAIEHGCELITGDRDFGRFPGLQWRHPLG